MLLPKCPSFAVTLPLKYIGDCNLLQKHVLEAGIYNIFLPNHYNFISTSSKRCYRMFKIRHTRFCMCENTSQGKIMRVQSRNFAASIPIPFRILLQTRSTYRQQNDIPMKHHSLFYQGKDEYLSLISMLRICNSKPERERMNVENEKENRVLRTCACGGLLS
jgi:hypothetical protein